MPKLSILLAVILMVVAALSLVPWLGFAIMSPMAFDSGVSAPAVLFVGALLLFPVWLIAWEWLAWRSVRADAAGTASIRAVIAMLPACILLGYMTLSR